MGAIRSDLLRAKRQQAKRNAPPPAAPVPKRGVGRPFGSGKPKVLSSGDESSKSEEVVAEEPAYPEGSMEAFLVEGHRDVLGQSPAEAAAVQNALDKAKAKKAAAAAAARAVEEARVAAVAAAAVGWQYHTLSDSCKNLGVQLYYRHLNSATQAARDVREDFAECTPALAFAGWVAGG